MSAVSWEHLPESPAREDPAALDWDILLSNRSIQTGTAHRFRRTIYIAREHTVVHVTWGARHRLWGLLPPKAYKRTVKRLPLPEEIQTRPELLHYLRQKQPHWL